MFPGPGPLPQISIDELIVRGATFANIDELESVGASREDSTPPSIYAGTLFLMFVTKQTESINRENGSYYYAFSKFTAGSYELLETPRFSNDQSASFYKTLFYSKKDNYTNLNDVIDNNDDFLSRSPIFIPVDATHLELVFESNVNSEPMLLNRYPLETFQEWRLHIKPCLMSANLTTCQSTKNRFTAQKSRKLT